RPPERRRRGSQETQVEPREPAGGDPSDPGTISAARPVSADAVSDRILTSAPTAKNVDKVVRPDRSCRAGRSPARAHQKTTVDLGCHRAGVAGAAPWGDFTTSHHKAAQAAAAHMARIRGMFRLMLAPPEARNLEPNTSRKATSITGLLSGP